MARNDYNAFIDNLKTIYGNANLSDQTISQLSRTWKKNPNFITNAALQKKNAINDAALQEATTQAQQSMKNITSKYWDDVHAMEDASAAQDEKDYMDAGYTYDINKGWTKPAAPAPKAFNEKYWLGRAKQFGFNSIDEVKAWQQQNGLTVDGMFGGASENKFNELNQQQEEVNPYAGRDNRTITRGQQPQAPVVTPPNTGINSAQPTNKRLAPFSQEKPNGPIFKLWNWLTTPAYDTSKYQGKGQPRQDIFMKTGEAVYNTFGNAYKHKGGGNINKFNNGGKPMNQKQMEEAFVQFLIQDAQAHGIDPNDQQAIQQYIQSLGKEGLAAKQQEFMQRWEGTPSRKLGGHLAYLNKLKGNCPDGEEMIYMKNGNKLCPKCMKKAEKAKGGTDLQKKNAISDFKEKRIAQSDTVHVGGQPRSLTDSQNRPLVKGMKTYSASEYQKDMKDAKKGKKDAANRVEKSDMKTAYGCGGATKKLVKKKK